MRKLLIVDDESELVDLLQDVLDDGETEVLAAYDGEQGLDVARREQPGLILTDIMMPKLDGLGLCKALQSDSATRHTPVVLMTAMHNPNVEGCEAVALIPKPFDIGKVRRIVEAVLGAHPPGQPSDWATT